MDPVIAYLLLRNIEKEKEKEVKNKGNNIPLVLWEKDRNYSKVSCSRCGQNTYWCQCLDKGNK